jgi:hypothetical protein
MVFNANIHYFDEKFLFKDYGYRGTVLKQALCRLVDGKTEIVDRISETRPNERCKLPLY